MFFVGGIGQRHTAVRACAPSRAGWPSTAPSLRAQLRRAMPLFTSHSSISRMRRSASSEPSITMPKPPLITSPQPTPPPLWIETHVAPRNAVADDVLHGHVGRQVRTVVDVRGLAVGRIGARNVVVVAAQHHGSRDAAVGDGPVERLARSSCGLRSRHRGCVPANRRPAGCGPPRGSSGCCRRSCARDVGGSRAAGSPPALRRPDGRSFRGLRAFPRCRPSGTARSRSRRTSVP